MTVVRQIDGVLNVIADQTTYSTSGVMNAGTYRLGGTNGESFNLWDCDEESSLMVHDGNHSVKGDGLTVDGYSNGGIINAYLDTTNSEGTFEGNTVYLSLADSATNNGYDVNASGAVINYNDSKYNYVSATSGINYWTYGENSYGNMSQLGSQQDTAIINGTHNTIVGGGGTNTFNVEDGADRNFILGSKSGTDTLNDKAGSLSAGGYTFYMAQGANVNINAYGTNLVANLMASKGLTDTNFVSSVNSYAFSDYKATDKTTGLTYDYFDVINDYKWNTNNYTGTNGINLQSGYVFDAFNKTVKNELDKATTQPIGYDTLS